MEDDAVEFVSIVIKDGGMYVYYNCEVEDMYAATQALGYEYILARGDGEENEDDS